MPDKVEAHLEAVGIRNNFYDGVLLCSEYLRSRSAKTQQYNCKTQELQLQDAANSCTIKTIFRHIYNEQSWVLKWAHPDLKEVQLEAAVNRVQKVNIQDRTEIREVPVFRMRSCKTVVVTQQLYFVTDRIF